MRIAGIAERSAYYAPVGLLVLSAGALLLPKRWAANAALLLFTIAPLPWLAEGAVRWSKQAQDNQYLNARRQYALSAGIPFDGRDARTVMEDMRRQGINAWPIVNPTSLIEDRGDGRNVSLLKSSDGKELLPLSGISNVESVATNEEGRYLIFRSDEHGFHNPPGVWQLKSLDLAVIGDSFTFGTAVPSESNLMAPVHRRWPNSLNLGYGGDGPLLELATMLEYLPQRKPKVVLWMVCEINDFGLDLDREVPSPLLEQYLRERRPLQNLEARQNELDSALRAHVERVREKVAKPAALLNDLAPLDRLRNAAYRLRNPGQERWDKFEQVLGAARDVVHQWNGKLIVAWLPTRFAFPDRGFLIRRQMADPNVRMKRMTDIAARLGLPLMNLEPQFEQAGPKLASFVYPYPSHFTAEGYTAIGNDIVKQLEAGGLLGQ